MDCLENAGLPAYEVSIGPDQLQECEEIFLTNSLAEIMPVGKIEMHEYKERKKTSKIKELFSVFCEKKNLAG